jgi:hypothetical protein
MSTKITQPMVETITAELYVVKIGNKQMTVSVYNQLYIEPCHDKDFNIIYDIWGKTNRDEEYVIFQKGNELRKMKIPRKNKIIPLLKCQWIFLKYEDDLQKIISSYNYKFVEMTDDERSNYILANEVKNFLRYDFTILTPEAFEIIGSDYIDIIQHEYQKYLNETIQFNKMVDQLNAARQLFIAV